MPYMDSCLHVNINVNNSPRTAFLSMGTIPLMVMFIFMLPASCNVHNCTIFAGVALAAGLFGGAGKRSVESILPIQESIVPISILQSCNLVELGQDCHD